MTPIHALLALALLAAPASAAVKEGSIPELPTPAALAPSAAALAPKPSGLFSLEPPLVKQGNALEVLQLKSAGARGDAAPEMRTLAGQPMAVLSLGGGIFAWDGGAWRRELESGRAGQIYDVAEIDGTPYAAAYNGLYARRADGAWRKQPIGVDAPVFQVSQIDGLLHATTSKGLRVKAGGWEHADTADNYPITVFKDSDGVLYEKTPWQIFSKRDKNASWGLSLDEVSTQRPVLVDGRLYAEVEYSGGPNALFEARDHGRWRPVGDRWTGQLENVVKLEGRVYALADNGVFVRQGEEWIEIGRKNERCLRLSLVDGRLVATFSSGVYWLEGDAWAKVLPIEQFAWHYRVLAALGRTYVVDAWNNLWGRDEARPGLAGTGLGTGNARP